MAFLIKNTSRMAPAGPNPGAAGILLTQFIHVVAASATLPATTTKNLFTVSGGRVLIMHLFAVVTVAIQNQVNNLKLTVVPGQGTATDIMANTATANLAVGVVINATSNAQAGVVSTNPAVQVSGANGVFLAGPVALIDATGTVGVTANGDATIREATSATNTGKLEWHCYYQPLDAPAYVKAAY